MVLRRARVGGLLSRFTYGTGMQRLTTQARAMATKMDRKVPTLEEAHSMPKAFCELSNDTLFILAEQGDHNACIERLIRHVMHVDQVDWYAASETVLKIRKENRKVNFLVSVPCGLGFSVSLISGIASLPLVFHYKTAFWFNDRFVTTDIPAPADRETMLEVGSWTWGWNEPVLGTASFVLLCMQYCRNQLINLDIKPYTHYVRNKRAQRLVEMYPQYDEDMLKDFSATASMTPMWLRYD